MKNKHESTFVLRECPLCHWALCLCALFKAHKPDCRRRIAITCTSPKPCVSHERYACWECEPCSCAAVVVGKGVAA